MVPPKSQVSWRTIPKVRRRLSRVISRVSTPSTAIAPAVDLVEAHEQVHERRLAGAGRARRWRRSGPAATVEVEVLDERRVRLVAERDVLQERPGRCACSSTRGLAGVRDLLGLVEQLEDPLGRGDRRLQDVHDAGDLGDRHVNCREYWMNAWTSPSDIVPVRDLHAADDRDRDVVQVADEVHRRLDDPGDELGPEARLEELLVLLVEAARSPRAGVRTTFTTLWPVCVSSTCPLSVPGALPLGRELLLRAPGDEHRDDDRRGHDQQRDQREQRADRRAS